MLRSGSIQAKPEIGRLVDELTKEEKEFDRTESRSAHRTSLVRAVEIDIRDLEHNIDGFSRNISATGIGLITGEPITEKTVATLTISRLKGSTTGVLSECRWCKPYGEKWFLSGWLFISVKRAPLSRRR
ncbi:MAG: PilZ domain-containing protein [Planctomycetota bacterium]